MQTILEVPGLVFGYRKKQVKFQNLSTQSHETFGILHRKLYILFFGCTVKCS